MSEKTQRLGPSIRMVNWSGVRVGPDDLGRERGGKDASEERSEPELVVQKTTPRGVKARHISSRGGCKKGSLQMGGGDRLPIREELLPGRQPYGKIGKGGPKEGAEKVLTSITKKLTRKRKNPRNTGKTRVENETGRGADRAEGEVNIKRLSRNMPGNGRNR